MFCRRASHNSIIIYNAENNIAISRNLQKTKLSKYPTQGINCNTREAASAKTLQILESMSITCCTSRNSTQARETASFCRPYVIIVETKTRTLASNRTASDMTSAECIKLEPRFENSTDIFARLLTLCQMTWDCQTVMFHCSPQSFSVLPGIFP